MLIPIFLIASLLYLFLKFFKKFSFKWWFFIVCVGIPLLSGILGGLPLASYIGKKLPFEIVVIKEKFLNATIETRKPIFPKWEYYLIGQPPVVGEQRIICE